MQRNNCLMTVAVIAAAVLWLPSAVNGQLIGHYALDEINAGTTPDSTAINGDGILNGGPTLAVGAGKIGSAFSFTGGTGEFVGITDAGFGQTAFTASVWFNPDSLGNTGPLANWTNAGPSPRTFLIRTQGANFQTFVRDSTPLQVGGTATLPTETLTASDFNHAVITYDGQTMRAYLNGEQSTNPFSFAGLTPLGEGVQGTAAIGGRGSSEQDFAGLIDDTAFWSETLTDGKVRALFTLADEVALNYDASQADTLFQVFDGGLPTAEIGDLTWTPASGLGGNLGDVVVLGANSFFLNLDGTSGVVGQVAAVPEPASVAMWVLLGLGGAGFAAWRRRRR